jgi:hypothetical protein
MSTPLGQVNWQQPRRQQAHLGWRRVGRDCRRGRRELMLVMMLEHLVWLATTLSPLAMMLCAR